MSGFFSIDNPFFTFMGKVCDMMIISLLWFVCCLPIVTIGPATTALYYVMVKVIRRERGYVFREYCRSFKENFKVGTISGVILVLLAVILVIDYNFAIQMMQQNSMVGNIFFAVYCAIIMICLCILMFIFPILSRFTVTVKGLFKTAFFISIQIRIRKNFPNKPAVSGRIISFAEILRQLCKSGYRFRISFI